MSGSTSSPRASVMELVQAALLATNLAWTTLCLGGVRAETMVVTAILTIALLVVHAASLLCGGRPVDPETDAASVRRGRIHPASWLFVPFLGYALVNLVWVTPVRWLGWMDWFGWLQAFVVYWVALNEFRSQATRRILWGTLFGLAVACVVLGAYQRFARPEWLMLGRTQAAQYVGRASGLFGVPNSMAALLLLLLPTAGALALRRNANAVHRVFFGWLALVLLFGLGLTISRGAWLGFTIALTAWPLMSSRASWLRRGALAAAVLGGVIAVACVTYAASPKVRERLSALVHDMGERSRPILWRAAWKMTRAHPLFGTGAGSFNVEFEQYRPEGFLNEPLWAHNDYLNTLSDYGAVGFVLLFGAVVATIAGCARRGPRDRRDDPPTAARNLAGARGTPGAWRAPRTDPFGDPLVLHAQVVGLLAFSLQLFVDFHFKIPALAMACATVGGLTVQSMWFKAARSDESERSAPDVRLRSDAPIEAVPEHGRSSAPRTRVASLSAAFFFIVAVLVALTMLPLYRAEALRVRARERIDSLGNDPPGSALSRERVATARRELDRAVSLAPADAAAWADRAYAEAQWSRVETSETAALGRRAEEDANRALAIAPLVMEYWIRRGVARDMQGLWDAAGDDFTHALTLAPNIPLPWYHYAYHLSLHPTGREMAVAMVQTCLRLDPQNREALRLRQQLATGHFRP